MYLLSPTQADLMADAAQQPVKGLVASVVSYFRPPLRLSFPCLRVLDIFFDRRAASHSPAAYSKSSRDFHTRQMPFSFAFDMSLFLFFAPLRPPVYLFSVIQSPVPIRFLFPFRLCCFFSSSRHLCPEAGAPAPSINLPPLSMFYPPPCP